MANEKNMIKLLADRVKAHGDDGRKRILGHHGQIADLCAALLTRLHAGDPEAVTDIAEVRLLNEAIQRGREKSADSRQSAMAFQDAIVSLYGFCTDAHQDQIDTAIMKIELEKSVAK